MTCLEVADSSGMVSVIMWNAPCPEWFKILRVGLVFLLQDYSVKKNYPFRIQPVPMDPQIKLISTMKNTIKDGERMLIYNMPPLLYRIVGPDFHHENSLRVLLYHPNLKCSGTISAHCNLQLLGSSDSPASASQDKVTTGLPVQAVKEI
uniref:mitogen-activated protein kinase kinase kinase kinase 1-like n=1 Tax=Callithrix jacchus TaxID=9483 RepID=UPI0023DD5F5C|nr:mitogen-activated protein kinase kinase kinase kinase 1-like [Callithrix jacchus]